MIVPNLLVDDLVRSVSFYTEVLGFELVFTVDAAKNGGMGECLRGAVFASLEWGESELMLQTAPSLAEDVPGAFTDESTASPSGTLYLRGFDPDSVPREAGGPPTGVTVSIDSLNS